MHNRSGLLSRATFANFVAGVMLPVGLFFSSFACSGALITHQEEVIVTGVRESLLPDIPKNVSVINARDIELSPSNNLIDLISREANITLRTTTGTDKFGGVDIRGMGDTFSSNVIVMVDGKKLNSPDLSGADLSSIPLWSVQSIEIVRGANTVRYGDGAVAGVINIITKRPDQRFTGSLLVSAASYDTEEQAISVGTSSENYSLGLIASRYRSNGYRDNGGLDKNDIRLTAGYVLTSSLSLRAELSHHHDEYGVPGVVSAQDFHGSSSSRKSTSSPNDGGETDDDRGSLQLSWEPHEQNKFSLVADIRDRENIFINGYAPTISIEDQQSTIDEDTKSFEALYSWNSKDMKIFFDSGYLHRESDYIRYENGRNVVTQSEQKIGDIENSSMFAAWSFILTPNITLDAGYRYDRTHHQQKELLLTEDCVFSPFPNLVCSAPYFDNTTQIGELWENHASEIGLIYQVTDRISFYSNWAKTYRNPNIDELVEASPDLHPQTGINVELGVRSQPSETISYQISYYRIKNEEEIYYDGTANRNSDQKTKRDGIEIEFKWNPYLDLSFRANATFSRSKFENSGAEIPLVPNKNFSIGVEYSLIENLIISASGKYVGQRYDGSDRSNDLYPELGSYQVWNYKLLYQQENSQFFISINNAYDEVYASSGYNGTFYPMPDRNASLGFKIFI